MCAVQAVLFTRGGAHDFAIVVGACCYHLGDDNDKSIERPDKITAYLGCPPNVDKGTKACEGAKNGLMPLTASLVYAAQGVGSVGIK